MFIEHAKEIEYKRSSLSTADQVYWCGRLQTLYYRVCSKPQREKVNFNQVRSGLEPDLCLFWSPSRRIARLSRHSSALCLLVGWKRERESGFGSQRQNGERELHAQNYTQNSTKFESIRQENRDDLITELFCCKHGKWRTLRQIEITANRTLGTLGTRQKTVSGLRCRSGNRVNWVWVSFSGLRWGESSSQRKQSEVVVNGRSQRVVVKEREEANHLPIRGEFGL